MHKQNALAKRRRHERLEKLATSCGTGSDVTSPRDVTARRRASPLPTATPPAEERDNRCHGDAERDEQDGDPGDTGARLANDRRCTARAAMTFVACKDHTKSAGKITPN